MLLARIIWTTFPTAERRRADESAEDRNSVGETTLQSTCATCRQVVESVPRLPVSGRIAVRNRVPKASWPRDLSFQWIRDRPPESQLETPAVYPLGEMTLNGELGAGRLATPPLTRRAHVEVPNVQRDRARTFIREA